MGISPSALKLRHCYWRDGNQGIHRVREAVLHYPKIEELDIDCYVASFIVGDVRALPRDRYGHYISNGNISGIAFNDELQVFGPQLKHLSLRTNSLMEISLLLQNCDNFESLRIDENCLNDFDGDNFSDLAHPVVRLPNLKR
ncbi:hypothetical protein AVEN_237890-1 [Araneus ventricosus]|uniref:Uncharacterized protein n=1 Tax=Araneus ventricosus TaxID=182803 RepID=A0A4Y2PRJ9_ARAVE|nr:hypothetical protein AVEN_237890-1 [Araneus ventricosus]